MLRFSHVGFAYGRKTILHDISFSVPRGHTVALIGESGAGKSTLARLAAGLLQASAGVIERPQQAAATQMIFQSSSLSLSPHLSVFELVAEGLLIQGLTRAQAHARVMACLASVGLGHDVADRYAAQLSGGQRQRVNIARALIMQPQLIIADEPVSALDVSVQAQICNVLKPLVHSLNCGMLLIIHDLALAEYMADSIVVLQRGRLIEQGPAAQIIGAPQQPYTRELLRANGYSL